MTASKKSGGSEPPDQETPKRLTIEEMKILAEEAKGDPVKTKALMKTVVNQTIDEVEEELGKEGPTAAE